MSAFLLTDFSRSLLDFLRESLLGCSVESESVTILVVIGEEDPLLAFSRLARPVFGCSFAGLLGATEFAYRPDPSMMLSYSSTSSTCATIVSARPDMAVRAHARKIWCCRSSELSWYVVVGEAAMPRNGDAQCQGGAAFERRVGGKTARWVYRFK